MSNLTQRILTAVVAIPIIVILCMVGGAAFFIFVALISAVALHEFYRLSEIKGAKPLRGLGTTAGFFINLSFFHAKTRTAVSALFEQLNIAIPFPSQAQMYLLTIILALVILTLVELFRNNGSSIMNLSTTLFGVLYISTFFGTFVGLREIFTPQDFPILRYFASEAAFRDPEILSRVYRWGGYTVISLFAIIWICDTAAFHVGSVWGKHKLYPRVSPNKSWEGAIAGFIFAIISAMAAKYLVLEYLPVGSAVVVGAIVGTIGQLGDLAESLMKRDAGVKDSSTLIPGHGGAFDRFDSLLLVAPCVYLYMDYVLFG